MWRCLHGSVTHATHTHFLRKCEGSRGSHSRRAGHSAPGATRPGMLSPSHQNYKFSAMRINSSYSDIQ